LIALQYIREIGPIGQSQLLSHAGSIENLFDGAIDPYSVPGLRTLGRSKLQSFLANPEASPQWEAAERTLDWLYQTGAKVLCKGDRHFPPLLKQLADCPLLLYLHGDASCLDELSLSIVGTRKPHIDGSEFTEHLAADLAEAGLLIVSGMAMGIDTAAHRGALSVGGKTAAVWATGLDVIYPPSNLELAHQIAASGCVITEMPLGTPSLPSYFPRRNRLVSGLSLGVVVVQAALPSGSLITAGYAAEQNREVFAVPGSVQNPLSAGCHQLIKDGATLVESAADILQVIDSLRAAQRPGTSTAAIGSPKTTRSDIKQQALIESLSQELREVLEAIGYAPVPFELIESRLEYSVDNLSTALIDLELNGLLSVTGGLYCRQYL
jgi:DNA processing protein